MLTRPLHRVLLPRKSTCSGAVLTAPLSLVGDITNPDGPRTTFHKRTLRRHATGIRRSTPLNHRPLTSDRVYRPTLPLLSTPSVMHCNTATTSFFRYGLDQVWRLGYLLVQHSYASMIPINLHIFITNANRVDLTLHMFPECPRVSSPGMKQNQRSKPGDTPNTNTWALGIEVTEERASIAENSHGSPSPFHLAPRSHDVP